MAKIKVAMIIVSLSILVESYLFCIIWSWHTKHYLHPCVEDTLLVTSSITVYGDTSLKRFWCLQGIHCLTSEWTKNANIWKEGGMHDLWFLVCPLSNKSSPRIFVKSYEVGCADILGPMSQVGPEVELGHHGTPNPGWTYLSPMVLTKAHLASECPWSLLQIQLFQLHPKHTESEFPGWDSIWRYINRLIDQFVKLSALLLLKMKNLRHERMADARATIS